MKKNLSLFAILFSIGVLVSSCSKSIAPFQKSSSQNFESSRNAIPTFTKEEFNEIIIEKKGEIISIQNSKSLIKPESNYKEDISASKESKKEACKIAKKKNAEIFNIKKIEEKNNAKLTLVQKVALKKLESKANKNASSGKVDIVSLLSLIFGGAGLIFMFTGIGGIFLGIAGFIMGIIALRKGTPNRTMAILGTVFGGIAILISLLILTLLASLFAIAL